VIRPHIDETDVKILHILQSNPRTTYLQLAQDCKVSIDSVRRRYERLKKEGIVVREIIALQPQAIGLEFLAWLGITTQTGKEKEVLQCIKEKPEIMLNYVEIGEYNIRSLLGLKHLNELSAYVDSLKKIQHVNDIDVMIWSNVQQMSYPRNLVIEPYSGISQENSKVPQNVTEFKTSSTSFVSAKEKIGTVPLSMLCPSIDKIDEGILNFLSQNARIPFSNIAKQLGISTKTVICRYKKLKTNWVAYTTLSINLLKLGYSGYASYNIKVSSKSWISDVFDKIVQIPNIVAALKIIGPYDINALAPFSSTEQLVKIHRSIAEIPGIDRISQQLGDSLQVWPAS
jgi:Lrp/AsnC family transcriptional regulator for asnA, asnC and gidA